MKRDFLKSLGIEDKDIIDKILDENSADIGRAKGELQTYKDRVTELEEQVTTKDSEIKSLQTKVGDTEKLNETITQLEADKRKLTSDLDTKVSEIQKTHAIESGIRDSKARNIKAVLAQLDLSKITYENGELTGLSEQLEVLKTNEDTSFLFGDSKPALSGTHTSTPNSNGNTPPTSGSFAEAVAKALGKN